MKDITQLRITQKLHDELRRFSLSCGVAKNQLARLAIRQGVRGLTSAEIKPHDLMIVIGSFGAKNRKIWLGGLRAVDAGVISEYSQQLSTKESNIIQALILLSLEKIAGSV